MSAPPSTESSPQTVFIPSSYSPMYLHDTPITVPSPSDAGPHLMIPQLIPFTSATSLRGSHVVFPNYLSSYMLIPQTTVISQSAFQVFPYRPEFKAKSGATEQKRITHINTPTSSCSVATKGGESSGEDQRIVSQLVSEYQCVWQACHKAALQIQRHESLHGEILTEQALLKERHALYVAHTLAAQDVLALTNELLANSDFTGEVYVSVPVDEDLDRHIGALRITQQFFQTHIDTASAVLNTVEVDVARLRAEIDSRKLDQGSSAPV
ncbi:hypothetical protein Hypma_005814 [Hypsizygus marmoreus]|uniref:Uncharacterized protein n=1 Tax=Hypsizygus marmoreus TaxID=39966 RepID=A0A369K9N7_HYPMA|nr:hypothetical protein Hypma_005814 [Hypsizygus marmoreus]